MAARHVMNITSTGCPHCRLAILKLFASPPNVNALSSARARPLQSRPRWIPAAPIRSFSSPPTQNGPLNGTEPADERSEEADELDSQGRDDAAKGSGLANIPWYLQVEPPRHVATIEPPPLPEVPDGSPKVVGSLLEYTSEELGLEELSLLDLRELDPPAALGPNLFMLFGTARSERHLNVSAGRLLRWLRAEHRIYAHADGLLGPNERKTKLRRKAKRAKLIGRTEDSDDGIRTGWICVNLGTIGRSNDESAIVTDDGRVAGFGVSQTGYTIIIQIMTESRRAEMGLEALWEKALGKPLGDSSKSEGVNTKKLHPLEEAILSSSRPPAVTKGSQFNDTSRKIPFEQKRAYSTQQAITHDAPEASALFAIDSKEALEQALKFDARQKYRILDLLRLRLGKMSTADQRDALGNLGEDVTPFVRISKSACQSLPPHKTWGFRLAVEATAYKSNPGHHFRSLENVQGLIDELNLYAINATREQYLQLLTCIYGSAVGVEKQHELAQQLLRTMQQRGEPIIAHDIIVTIIETVCQYRHQDSWDDYLALIRQLTTTLPRLNLPCMDEPLLMRLMSAYRRIEDWKRLWSVWLMRPKYALPRSAAMYVHFYQLIKSRGSLPFCAMAVSQTFQGLLAESPRVLPNRAVSEALMDCIRIAKPEAENMVMRGADSKNEFVRIIRLLRLMEN
ncbi:uncharacterized protein F4807DRAFT_42754 [Annulohypoxylon truncatum]|uniref:uncharacterized protein n=1 Tax=Annulohypoxylon truncatum TaxID=327061 RepID=UPI0020089F9B|nr:uncharacterized protein F4807DRAFT_42754 [Annulohypoxylon truncatum]KAI1210905.1 hypothetical protein F4807DRAFT_42754 [Annulohypoxylon truncatum]